MANFNHLSSTGWTKCDWCNFFLFAGWILKLISNKQNWKQHGKRHGMMRASSIGNLTWLLFTYWRGKEPKSLSMPHQSTVVCSDGKWFVYFYLVVVVVAARLTHIYYHKSLLYLSIVVCILISDDSLDAIFSLLHQVFLFFCLLSLCAKMSKRMLCISADWSKEEDQASATVIN